MRERVSLAIGAKYTKGALAELFNLQDPQLGNGIFRPEGAGFVWLFARETPVYELRGYRNSLDADDLSMSGQKSGRTDDLIIRHSELGLDLLVFYRKQGLSSNWGYQFEGPFQYVSHDSSRPTGFHLRRVPLGGKETYDLEWPPAGDQSEGEFATLGRLVRNLRKERGLTQDELARSAAVDQSWLSKLERGVIPPDYSAAVRRVTDAVGLPPSALAVRARNAESG